MEYRFRDIEKKWQDWWKENQVYQVSNNSPRPKLYVLDMFPYPSGAGLHVGHPLGYIASDIYARFKRLKGFNVLHPMGFDAFGLPAEQYAIEEGIHPAISTDQNIANFKKQLDNIGFCFDWSRELRTSDPRYYKWTQWIFLQLFKSFFNRNTNKAEPIASLVAAFEKSGNKDHQFPVAGYQLPVTANRQQSTDNFFTSEEWKDFDEKTQQDILMEYRLAYCGYGEVNWCEALGTVLANDEVVNGVSERGGYPVVKKKLRQWYLRITEYADRLLQGLETVDFSEAMKEMQTNWIGKSEGAEIEFRIKAPSQPSPGGKGEQQTEPRYQTAQLSLSGGDLGGASIRVYTTRPDTIFGVDFMVIAPEHELVEQITTAEQKKAVEEYLDHVKSRNERERMAEKKITGVFTGAYVIHPFSKKEIPIWISEYVLIGYGTGAIMAVPCGDERDHKFAKHFNIPITNIIGKNYNGEEANPTKDAVLENSDFLNGMVMKDAISVAIKKIEELGIGQRKVNYKMRDAAFSRQRYWGEPIPIVWKNGIAYPLDEKELPLELPHVETYKPGPEGEGPLANIKEWTLIPSPSPQAEKGAKGAALVPKYSVSTPMQYELAKQMRKEYTEAENILWQALRGNKLGVKFRRQHPIEKYIADFISLQNRLIIEVDGGYHETEEQKEYDELRTKTLQEIGFRVIRFSNKQVKNNLHESLEQIKKEIAESHNPLSTRGEGQGVRETNTMPGYAGSSWYFLRYMDPHDDKTFCERKISDYWNQVDLYIGGTEHAVGHLLYSRMWTKVLYDLNLIGFDEPYRKLVNQGMIQGSSRFVYRINGTNTFVSKGVLNDEETYKGEKLDKIHVDVNFVDGIELDIKAFRKWRGGEYKEAEFILEDGKYICGTEVEKMSKSKFNAVNPDDIVARYGADTFRIYEMFLGPVEMSKPWDTKGIEGSFRFLKKFWRLFVDEEKGLIVADEPATKEELKTLHKTIKKIEEDTERFSFNTGVSAFMIATNELTDLKCHKRSVLEPLLILLSPFAPHIAEELYQQLRSSKVLPLGEPAQLNHSGADLGGASILDAAFPIFEEKYVKESSKMYPVAVNGKTRTEINIALDATQQQVEEIVLADETVKKWLEGKSPKKIIYVKNKMVNLVL